MIRSMTGFGEAERSVGARRYRVEIRTVNHRFLHPRIHTPPGLDALSLAIRKSLERFLYRGHVTCSLSIERAPGAPTEERLELDLAKARSYAGALRRLREELGIEEGIALRHLIHFGDLFRHPAAEPSSEEVDSDVVRDLTGEAAGEVVAMREREGAKIEADLEERLANIEEEVGRLERAAPGRLLSEAARLRAAVAELTEREEVDEERLAREIAYLAEKRDVNEEIVRLRAHLHFFREIVAGPASEPAGKRLGFVVQEMHREANTIGSKSHDAGMSRSVVRIKEEIERLREQLENVE